MLGRAAKDPSEIIKNFSKEKGSSIENLSLQADFKYDGERTQMHYQKVQNLGQARTTIKLFSRNFELQNSKFWHIEDLLQQQLAKSNHSFIVDGEIVYVDPRDGKFLPF